ncbi:hypothetical protein Hamer_G006594 [Homarus americanus]|uniref:Uncharacterized protein n=1 Tax=Homarus americanus TaxID=6706 RepID=A0A8J5JH72_HOMAM|nr:hypothetical protein Hamer_G006594 [Homarus americanus]
MKLTLLLVALCALLVHVWVSVWWSPGSKATYSSTESRVFNTQVNFVSFSYQPLLLPPSSPVPSELTHLTHLSTLTSTNSLALLEIVSLDSEESRRKPNRSSSVASPFRPATN